MTWPIIFLLVILKIPVLYLCAVVWWAIRAEPRREQPAALAGVAAAGPGGPAWTRASRPRRRPPRGPERRPSRRPPSRVGVRR